jgi:hypothetical protein
VCRKFDPVFEHGLYYFSDPYRFLGAWHIAPDLPKNQTERNGIIWAAPVDDHLKLDGIDRSKGLLFRYFEVNVFPTLLRRSAARHFIGIGLISSPSAIKFQSTIPSNCIFDFNNTLLTASSNCMNN